MSNRQVWLKIAKNIFIPENKNVSFVPLEKNKIQRFKNDSTFILLFLLIPYALSFLSTIFPYADRVLMYVLSTIIKLILYTAGYFAISYSKRHQLKLNGGIAFFWSLFIMEGLLFVVVMILSSITNSSVIIGTINLILYDMGRILVVFLALWFSSALRKDIVYVLLNRIPILFLIIGVFYILDLAGGPFFDLLNNLITGGTTSQNQGSLNSVLEEDTFRTYWLIITIVIIAPIFEEVVYRHSLMLIMDIKVLKFLVPFLHFAFIHVSKSYYQDFSHVFIYIWGSFLLTLVMFMKKNIVYSIGFHALSNQMTFFF